MARILKTAYTFDDVLLVPNKSEVLPNQVSLKTKLTKTITLNMPLMSASMDTVTESKMAIAMAREGGIGIIHKNMTIEDQAREVDRVKRQENGVITDPIFLNEDHTVREALEAEGLEFLEAAVKMIPDTYTEIDEDAAKKFQKMLDLLEDDDDVQEVYHNAEFPEGWDE